MHEGSLLSFGLVGLSVVLSVCGQLVMKLGVSDIGAVDTPTAASLTAFFREAFLNPFVWAGFAMYGVSAVAWLIVLSRLDLSLAYPFLALNFLFITLVSRIFLGEEISTARWLGVLLICLGIVVVARSRGA